MRHIQRRNRIMTRFCHRLAAVMICVVTLGATGSALTIKLASLAPNGSPWDKGLRAIAARWSEVSDGKVTLKIYPGGIAGGEQDMIRKMRIGQLGAAGLTGVGLSRIYPGVLALHLPLTVRTDEELTYVLEKAKPTFEAELEKKGFKVLIWTKVGWAHFFAREPVIEPGDLKKQKLFIYEGDPDGEQAWKDAGFHVVPLSPTDLSSGIQTGMVDAFTTTPLSAASYQWFKLVDHMCGMKWAPLIGAIVISTRTWNRIPEDLRPRLERECRKIGTALQDDIDEADRQAVEEMKKSGLEVNPVTEEDVAQWRAEVEEGFQKVVGKSFDRSSYELVRKHLESFRNADGE
ncbi:MAG: C4-dicarboxylate ABC transporter substrate-binding protein [Chitinivibrionales bacterium]|nr:C4-dicarboxylate ABC transporter substrate-binding protein [Chitinivibrionales bacterium]MBD3355809.1 C4-dicarboxylate ABC transporter substrate-binding protein [Chitinivibrionales bacterium]